MPLEKSITNSILRYLNSLDGCIAEKVFGGMCGSSGRADIHGCWWGRSIQIEVKTPDHGNKPSKAQEIYLQRWSRAGALCIVAYSLDDVKGLINNG